jgi:hypothetical protein
MLNSRAENLTQDLCMDMHDSYARTKTSKNPIVHRSKPFKSASGLILYHHPKKYFTPMYPTAGTAAIPAIAGSPSTAAPPIAALWAAAYHDPAVTPALPILAIAAAAVEPAAGPTAVNPRTFNTTGVATLTATPVAVAIAAAVPTVSAIFAVFVAVRISEQS